MFNDFKFSFHQFLKLPGFTTLARLTLVLGLGSAPAAACTIFVLTDANRALFCNNEDWSNSVTRLWFVPAGDRRLGCAYVGFDNMKRSARDGSARTAITITSEIARLKSDPASPSSRP